jgi:hypothetical protein
MVVSCAGCGGKPRVARGKDLAHCENCNHYWIPKPIGTKKYDLEYYRKYEEYSNTLLGQKINESRWNLIEQYVKGHKTILDWGCATGSFIRASSNGYKVFGYDINPHSPFRDKDITSAGYDAVTAWDVVEHMENPLKWAESLNAKHLIVLTPDASRLRGKFDGWKHYRPDEHQHYFTKESLVKFMDRAGFIVRELNHDEGKLRDPKNPNWLVTCVGERS